MSIYAAVSAIIFVFGLLLIGLGLNRYSKTQHIESTGKTQQATVTQLRRARTARSSFYYVSYTLTLTNPDGSPLVLNKTESTNRRAFASLSENGLVYVSYLPDDPYNTAQLSASYGGKDLASWMAPGGGLIVAALLVFVFSAAKVTPGDNQPLTSIVSGLPMTVENISSLRNVVSSHLTIWKEATDTQSHRATPSELALDPSLGILEVDYGRCNTSNGFYVYAVLNRKLNSDSSTQSDSYFYLETSENSSSLAALLCHPNNWLPLVRRDLSGGWYFGTITVLPPDTPIPSNG